MFTTYLYGMSYGDNPSAADLDQSISDGVGLHEHGIWPAHGHGEPWFSDGEVKYLESKSYRVHRRLGQVFSFDDSHVPPPVVATTLHQGRLPGDLMGTDRLAEMLSRSTGADCGSASQAASGPGEGALVVQHLNLRGG